MYFSSSAAAETWHLKLRCATFKKNNTFFCWNLLVLYENVFVAPPTDGNLEPKKHHHSQGGISQNQSLTVSRVLNSNFLCNSTKSTILHTAGLMCRALQRGILAITHKELATSKANSGRIGEENNPWAKLIHTGYRYSHVWIPSSDLMKCLKPWLFQYFFFRDDSSHLPSTDQCIPQQLTAVAFYLCHYNHSCLVVWSLSHPKRIFRRCFLLGGQNDEPDRSVADMFLLWILEEKLAPISHAHIT